MLGTAVEPAARSPGLLWGLLIHSRVLFASDDESNEIKLRILQPLLNVPLPSRSGTSASLDLYQQQVGASLRLP